MINLFDIKQLLISFICGFSVLCVIIYSGAVERLTMFLIGFFCSYTIMSYKKWSLKYFSVTISGIILGFFIAVWSILSIVPDRGIKPYPQVIKEGNQTAVLLILKGEEERYNISGLLEKMKEDKRFFNRLYSIIDLYQYKRAYERVGISKYNDQSREIYNKLNNLLDVDYDLYFSYMDGAVNYKKIIENKLMNSNYEKIIVAPIMLTESLDYLKLIDELNRYSVQNSINHIRFVQPLWNSEKLIRGIVYQIDAYAEGYENSNMGIILMSSTETEGDNRKADTTVFRQEMLFLENLKRQLIRSGYEDRKVKFVAPYLPTSSIKSAIEELQQYGVKEICIISINDIADHVRSIAHTEKIIKNMNKEKEFDINYIKGWGTSDSLIEELENRVRLLNVEDLSPDNQ
ncbi:ferrochelatase [Geosporobacter ferrireducens]|uniref:Ferrochelatase n=1 Tax=Geosporobacter ferrireducens TaxID=1424294 RepID=A0A1D8GC56_9FIRM|nr:ferrochelatase [Geosporobacter ferrireducens]AOT68471.1 hypothetical protein Gferi_02015 [Geosporobacter ferrireducens]MTI53933.1 hypothetical protein [Geosporobacter ferrireducens]